MSKFICPIPWISLSLGAKNIPRLCCHQDISLEGPIEDMETTIQQLPHTKTAREKMLRGEVPRECSTCHQLEQAGCASPRLEYLRRFSFSVDKANPIKYLDITPDNECNLECMMCSPLYSKKLSAFYEKTYSRPPEKAWETQLSRDNIRSMLPDLEQVTLAGGEPLLSSKSLSIIRELARSEQADQMVLRIFSNLSHLPAGIIEEFESFEKVELIVSVDSVAENYELIRFPAKWKNLLSNIETIKKSQLANLELHLHAVVMATNWLHMGELIHFFQEQFQDSSNIVPILIEIDTRSILHPRVLPVPLWNKGKESLLSALEKLNARNIEEKNQIEDIKRLIIKMEKEEMSNRYVDYKIYLQKVLADRERRKN